MYGGHLRRVTKWINMPPDSRASRRSEIFLHKSKSDWHLVYDGIVVCGSFIIHAPSSIDELQLAGLCHQLTYLHTCEWEGGEKKRRERVWKIQEMESLKRGREAERCTHWNITDTFLYTKHAEVAKDDMACIYWNMINRPALSYSCNYTRMAYSVNGETALCATHASTALVLIKDWTWRQNKSVESQRNYPQPQRCRVSPRLCIQSE